MSFFEFPHTRTYDSDLGWLIWAMKKLIGDMTEFTEINSIKFADPINWNIATQYEPTTIVVDDEGNGYISRKAVPAGIALTDTEYWTRIFNFSDITDAIRESIAVNAGDSPTTPVALSENDLVWWNGKIYKVLYDIAAGTAFIDGTNVIEYTVNDRIQEFGADIGNIEQALQNEITTRAQEDAILYEAMADNKTELEAAIDAETSAREAADDDLLNNINSAAAGVSEYELTDEVSTKYTTYKIGAQNIDSKVLNRTALIGGNSNYYLQSMCIIENNLLFGFARSDNNDSMLVETDITGDTIYRRININLGHCNDLSYNSKKNEVYAVPMSYGTYANKLVVLDYSTFTIKTTIDIGNNPFRCSYDEDNDLLYVENYANIYVIDSDLNIITTLAKSVLSVENTLNQGSFMYKGEYCPVAAIFDNTADNNGFVIWEYYKNEAFMLAGNSNEELEGVDIYNGKYLITAGRRANMIYIMKYMISNTTSPFNNTNAGTGRLLTADDDCNNLPNGKFYKPYGGDAVTNFPDNSRGGTLYQFTLGFDFIEQFCITDGGLLYFRRMNQAYNWDAWVALYDPRWLGNIDNITCAGFVTTGATEIRFTVPVPKMVSRFTFTGSIVCRNVAGSIFVNEVVDDTLTLTTTIKNGMPNCILKKSDGTAFSATNNTPVSVTFFGSSV